MHCCPSSPAVSFLGWFLSFNPDSFFKKKLWTKSNKLVPSNLYLKSLTLPEGKLCSLLKKKQFLQVEKPWSSSSAFIVRHLRCTNYTTLCWKKENKQTNLWGFRQPLNYPPATFISNNLHNFASVRCLNLQKSLSKCKTKTLVEPLHCLIQGEKYFKCLTIHGNLSPLWRQSIHFSFLTVAELG